MARAKVIGQVVAGSQPSLSVTGRADGGGYTVTAGARSLSITAEAGATLLTTVTDQDNASITVTDSTSTTPSWTAPSGGTTGADYCVQVTATKGGYTEQVSFSELVDGSGGGGGGGLAEILDFTGVSYDFLTTGGTSGTGGEGPHTVNGVSMTLSYNGSSGPDALAFVSGVLQHTGNVSTKQAYLIIDMGLDVQTQPLVINLSAENLGSSSSQSFIPRIAAHNTVGVQDNTLGALWGWDGAADDTSILVREANSGVSFTTIQQLTGLTDITTTPTRFAYHFLSGAALISYDQGTAALPTDGGVLGTVLSSNLGIGAGATTRQNRRYVHLFLLESVDVRINSYKLEPAP
jgi:hypothetical protein